MQNRPSKVWQGGFFTVEAPFHGYVLPSRPSASKTRWREKNTSCRTDRIYSFDCQSYLYCKKYIYSVTILLVRARALLSLPLFFSFFRKCLAEAFTTPIEIWMQPSLQNKLTASLRLIVDAWAAGCGGVGCRRRRRVTSDERFHNISVSVPSSLVKACSPAVTVAASMFVASPQREEKKRTTMSYAWY